ncbi:Uncharacterized protein DAT39_019856, partial [Clarias magur]
TTCLVTLSSASRCWGATCCSPTRCPSTRAWASPARCAASSPTHTSNSASRTRPRADSSRDP